jgi:hypothetical protein
MTIRRLLIALTCANLGLLVFLLARARADDPGVATVLRVRALEIIDGRGKVRAELRVFPADPKHKLSDGDPYPETVLLRLIDPNGRPSVKLSTSVRGGGIYLGGASDPTYARLGADGAESELFLQNKDGVKRKIGP